MDANVPSGGQPPGWVPPPGPPDPDQPGWPQQPGAWGPAPQYGAWGVPQRPWAPKEKRKRFGWGMVILGFLVGGFLSFLVTMGGVVAIGIAVTPHPVVDSHPAIAEGADAVRVGDCLDDRPATVIVVDQTDVVDCNEAHDSEVSGVIVAPGPDHRPGKDDLDAYVDETCNLAFRGYVGSDPLDSQYTSKGVVPTEKAWADGDRTVFCLVDTVGTPDGAGTVRNSHD